MTRSQAVMDSEADAETLRLFVGWGINMLSLAENCATYAVAWYDRGEPDLAADAATRAAHYAFLAVPGLRG